MKRVYFDNAATTRINSEVLEVINEVSRENFGNPSSIYSIANDVRNLLLDSRDKVAGALNALPEEIFFTSGGTEADNWAIKGVAEAFGKKGKHIITTNIEHHAVLHTCKYLERQGFEVTYLPVDEYGLISLEDLKNAIKDETILISIMFANNEIGTIQPIEEIGKIAREKNILFHTDAVQAFGKLAIDVAAMNIDLLSISGHKLHGPKGIGALYVRKGVRLPAFIHGGAQEKGKRAGTENTVGIAALGKAVEVSLRDREEKNRKTLEMRDALIESILKEIPYCRLNGDAEKRLPGNVNISFEFIEGESLLLSLDMAGFMASSGSACTSGSLDPSHVLLAIGLPHEKAHGSLRVTLDSEENTMKDIERLMEVLPGIVQRLRDMSPLYEDFLNSER